jgi:hypothetical protein
MGFSSVSPVWLIDLKKQMLACASAGVNVRMPCVQRFQRAIDRMRRLRAPSPTSYLSRWKEWN